MACRDCGGNGSCGCSLSSSTSITVTGAGTGADPWIPRLELADTNPCLELTANGAGVLVQPGGGIIKTATGLRTATSAPIGLMGFAQATTNQATITTIVDLTTLSVTFTAVANRYYRIGGGLTIASTVANDVATVTIADAANAVQRTWDIPLPLANIGVSVSPMVIKSFSAGAQTMKFRLARVVGTGTLTAFASATAPNQILVEDIGGF